MADKVVRGDVLSQIDDSADREFWATEDDGNVPVREEEIGADRARRTGVGMAAPARPASPSPRRR
jgi:hypothetical protein